jgi:hypothetical protein
MDVNKMGEEKIDSLFDECKPLPTYCEAKDILKTLAIICRASLMPQSVLL